MTRGRNWTAAEKNYLQDQWGNVSIVTLAKKLNRSQAAVMLKASRMGLGAHLQSDSRVTLNELLATIYGYEVGGYTKNKLIQEGIPVKKHKVKNNSFMVISKKKNRLRQETANRPPQSTVDQTGRSEA